LTTLHKHITGTSIHNITYFWKGSLKVLDTDTNTLS